MRMQLAAAALALGLAGAAGAQTDPLAPLQAAAQQGDVAAQMDLARRYEKGVGVVQNFARAAEWYARAVKAGDLEAANRLGRFHHAGLGVARDLARAVDLLEGAAQSGKADHLYDLAVVLESDAPGDGGLERAAELYRDAAAAGHMDAAVSLGVLLQDGRGVAQDFEAAAEIYRRASQSGHPRAQNNLGLLYVRGDGVEQDYERAAELFRAASEQGLPQAMTNLGVLYENGFGVRQSDERAADLYRLGGQGGTTPASETRPLYDDRLAPPPEDPEARAALDRAALAGDPVAEFQVAWLMLGAEPVDPRRALQAALLLRRSAETGYAPAMANLALLYFRGAGVPQDYVLGHMWLVLAGSHGFERAAGISAFWTGRMTADQLNDAQARAETKWAQLRENQ